jgi:type I restriction enzyme M protein
VEAPKFKDYILPLVFMRRLSDVLEDELARLGEELGDAKLAEGLVAKDHALVRFYLPAGTRSGAVASKHGGIPRH